MFNKINKKIVSIFTIFIMFFAISIVFGSDFVSAAELHFENTCTYYSKNNKQESVVVKKRIADDVIKTSDKKIFETLYVTVSVYNGTSLVDSFSGFENYTNRYFADDDMSNSINCSKYLNNDDSVQVFVESNNIDSEYVLYSENKQRPIINGLTCNYIPKDIKTFDIQKIQFVINSGSSLPLSASIKLNAETSNIPFYKNDSDDSDFTEKLAMGNCPQYLFLNPDNLGILDAEGVLMSWDISSIQNFTSCINCSFKMGNIDQIITFEYRKTEEQIQEELAKVEETTNLLQSYIDELNSLDCDSEKDFARCQELEEKIKNSTDEIDAMCKEQFDSSQFEGRRGNCEKYMLVREVIVTAGIIDDFRDGCSIISRDLRDFINWILSLIKIAGPIIVIVMGTLDFTKAAASSEADANKKAFDKLTKRLVMAVIIFIIPSLIQFVFSYFDVFNIAEGLDPSNPFCL